MIVVVVIAAVLVTCAALMALVRMERGPTMLDRALGLDLFTASLVCAIAIEAVWSRRTETVPILLAFSLVGFVGSVVISRFGARAAQADQSAWDPPPEAGAPRETGPADEEGRS